MITYFSKKISKLDILNIKNGYFIFPCRKNWIIQTSFSILKIEQIDKKFYSIFEPFKSQFKISLNNDTFYFFEKLNINDCIEIALIQTNIDDYNIEIVNIFVNKKPIIDFDYYNLETIITSRNWDFKN